MTFEMVDRDERLVVCEGQRLGGHDAHHHAADQPRPAGRGDGIEIGQADAGLVYVTDARAAGDSVTPVAFPESARASNTYPIAVLTDAQTPDLAQKFVDLVTGAAGRTILSAAGFANP